MSNNTAMELIETLKQKIHNLEIALKYEQQKPAANTQHSPENTDFISEFNLHNNSDTK